MTADVHHLQDGVLVAELLIYTINSDNDLKYGYTLPK